MIGVELGRENNARGRARVSEKERERETKGDIATRRGRKGSQRDRTIERPFPLDCREREPKGDFVRMLVQIQIGELGVENDSAKESSIGEADRTGETMRSIRELPVESPGVYRVRPSRPIADPRDSRSLAFDKKLYFSIFDDIRSTKAFLRTRVYLLRTRNSDVKRRRLLKKDLVFR